MRKKLCDRYNIVRNVSLKTLSSIKTGGKAKFVAFPQSEEELVSLLKFLNKRHKKYFVLGNGTNTLMPDGVYRGVIVKLSQMNAVAIKGNKIYAQAGASLGRVISLAINNGLSGLEEGSGIPASIGGGIIMNCGAYNFEMANVITKVRLYREGAIIELDNKQCKFRYRGSGFEKDDIILGGEFELKKDDVEKIKERQKEVLKKRKGLSPFPSLGSVFKRQDGIIVSKMLDEMGFKGCYYGDAKVCENHAGVIVNNGNAKSRDVIKLINIIKKRVKEEKNIILEEEIKILNK